MPLEVEGIRSVAQKAGRSGVSIGVHADYVDAHLSDLAEDEDLSRYIL